MSFWTQIEQNKSPSYAYVVQCCAFFCFWTPNHSILISCPRNMAAMIQPPSRQEQYPTTAIPNLMIQSPSRANSIPTPKPPTGKPYILRWDEVGVPDRLLRPIEEPGEGGRDRIERANLAKEYAILGVASCCWNSDIWWRREGSRAKGKKKAREEEPRSPGCLFA